MNDDELGLRLHDELHRRTKAPGAAPESIHEHVRDLRSMQLVRAAGSRRSSHAVRDLLGLAAAVAIVAAVGAGLLIRQSNQPATGVDGPKDGIEAFSRIDSRTAWAESGSDLYVTRDGGETWSKGTLPGGKSPGQVYSGASGGTSEATTVPTPTATPTSVGLEGSSNPVKSDPGAGNDPNWYEGLPNHYYPDFIDADRGWLLSWKVSGGADGSAAYALTVWRTSDGGRSWQPAAVPGTYRGMGVVQFVDASHGWITVIRSDSTAGSTGGQTSTGSDGSAASTPTAGPTIVLPSDTVTILATADGGATWSPISTIAAVALPHFVSPTEAWGYAYTDPTARATSVIHSTDRGRTWSTATLPIPAGDTVAPAWPAPPANANGSLTIRLAAGQSDSFDILSFASIDDGKTWTLESTQPAGGDTSYAINSLAALVNPPDGQPIVVGTATPGDATAASPFKATFDGGASWTIYPTAGLPGVPTSAEWTSSDDVWVMTAGTDGFMGTSGKLYATRDAGKTWQPLLGAPAWPASREPVKTPAVVYVTPAPEQVQSSYTIQEAGRIDASAGWVLTQDDASGDKYLRLTQDGGATWSEPRLAPDGYVTQMLDLNHGWILRPSLADTETVTVSRTADGGRTWLESVVEVGALPAATNSWFSSTAVHFRDALHGELLATFGEVDPQGAAPSAPWNCERFESSDGGATWSSPIDSPCLSGVTFQDETFGYASDARMSPYLYVTVDGGRTWTRGALPDGMTVGTTNAAALVQRHADGTLRALVSWGPDASAFSILASGDGGLTWTLAGTAVGLPPNGPKVAAAGEDRWVAVDSPNFPAVLASDDGGATWTSASDQVLPGAAASVQFVNQSDGWMVAVDTACTSSPTCSTPATAIYATRDGGATWTPIFTPEPTYA